jgi:hypothetical protein
MLYYISRNVHLYPEGQGPLIYLVSSVQAVRQAGMPFVFTDGMPIMMLSNYYDDLADLDRVDWGVMRSTWWNDTPEYPTVSAGGRPSSWFTSPAPGNL